MRRLFKYHTVLVLFILVPVLLIGLAIGLIGALTGTRAIHQMVNYLGYETNSRMVSDIGRFLRVPIQINEMNADALGTGRMSLDDTAMLESLLISRVKYAPSVTSVYFGNTKGGLIDAGREGPDGSPYVIVTDGFKAGAFNKYALRPDGRRGTLISSIPSFDARVRPWYQAAVAAGKPTWTKPFLLFTGQDTTISAVRPVFDVRGDMLGVVSVDIFLSQLNKFLVDLQKNLTGYCFIADAVGTIIATPDHGERAAALQNQSLQAAFGAHPTPEVPPVNYSGELVDHGVRYNIHARSLPDDIGLDWYVFSVYPESEFVRLIGLNVPAVVVGILAAFLLVAAMAIYLASIFRKPIHDLVAFSGELSKGRWQETPEPSFLYETEELRHSLVSMQTELRESFDALNREIAEKDEAHREIQALLAEKELILKEVHHRMKNNLSVIVSLLKLQEGAADDAITTATLREASLRVHSMMLLYDMLFQSDSFLEADVADYTGKIVSELSAHFDPQQKIRVHWDTEGLIMPSRILFLLGIVFNEIMTNAYKYAFPDGVGTIRVRIARSGDRAELSVSDDGIGFQHKSADEAKSGFGMKLIEALVSQIDGTLLVEGKSGVVCAITFPLPR